jgi:hypothetical protein
MHGGIDERRTKSLQGDKYAVGADRELKSSAMRPQLHCDALVVGEPQSAIAPIRERPSGANLDIDAGQISRALKSIDDSSRS